MYKPNCDVFWPGSYPFKDPETAIRRILKNPVMLLHWPQLPKRSRKERMLEQTYRAMFGGRRKKTTEEITNPDLSPAALTKGTAAGWSATWRAVSRRSDELFKTQIAGPVTLTASRQATLLGGKPSARKKARLFRYLNLWLEHAYWQIDRIRDHGFEPMVVLDEPLLPNAMGPSELPQARKVLRILQTAVTRLQKRKALVGLHCCNRVSPQTLIESGADLIHFDVCHFPTQLIRHRDAIQKFIKKGGIVAWGIVPTTEYLTPNLRIRLEKNLGDIVSSMEMRGLPLKQVLAHSMIAPTCGTGMLTPSDSDEIMNFTTSLSREMKSRYKL